MSNFFTFSKTSLSSRQRIVSLALVASCSISLTSTMAMADGPALYTQSETPSAAANTIEFPEQTASLISGVKGADGTAAFGALAKHARQVQTDTLSTSVSNTAKHRTLDQGPLLLSPTENTVVDTAYGTVSVDMGSVLLIIATNNELAVYNLYDTRKNAVVINYGSGTVSIPPERVAILARSSVESFSEVNPAPFVAYRQLSSRDLSSKMKLYQAEFDFGSLARGMPALKQLIAEGTGPTKKTMARMLKTAAIMTQISQSGESYGYYVTDKLLSAAASK